ncbi:MAG: hypothetical protein GX610_07670 [Rhodococcus sp.]|nr:hypothetical protein [Rhodococcus sp. (in: high G+C Gram-positive bacteria)]
MTGPRNTGEAELGSEDQERLGLIPEIRRPHLARAAFERYERRVVVLAIRDLEHDPTLAAGDFDLTSTAPSTSSSRVQHSRSHAIATAITHAECTPGRGAGR